MDQKWRLNLSGRIARNLLWLMVLPDRGYYRSRVALLYRIRLMR